MDGRALVQVLTLGPGLCGGDTFTIDVTVQPRRARRRDHAGGVTNPWDVGWREGDAVSQSLGWQPGGATRVLPGADDSFRRQLLVQRVKVSAHRDVARRHSRELGDGTAQPQRAPALPAPLQPHAVSIGGQPVFADALEIEPTAPMRAATGILENHRYVASGFWHGVPTSASLATPPTRVLMALDRCASRDDVFLRALASDGYEMATTLQSAVDAINTAWGFEPIPLRRFDSASSWLLAPRSWLISDWRLRPASSSAADSQQRDQLLCFR